MKQMVLFFAAVLLGLVLTMAAYAEEKAGIIYDLTAVSDNARREWKDGGIQGISVRFDEKGKAVSYAIVTGSGTYDNYDRFDKSLSKSLWSFSVKNAVMSSIPSGSAGKEFQGSGHRFTVSKVTGDMTIIDKAGEVFGGIGSLLGDVIKAIVNLGKTIVDGIGGFFKELFKILGGIIDKIADFFKDLIENIKKFFVPEREELDAKFKAFLGKNKRFWPSVSLGGSPGGFYSSLPSEIKNGVQKFASLAFMVAFGIYGLGAIRRFSDGSVSNS